MNSLHLIRKTKTFAAQAKLAFVNWLAPACSACMHASAIISYIPWVMISTNTILCIHMTDACMILQCINA